MSILSLLASDNFITVNRTLIKEVGLDAAVILGELASEANYWKENGEAEDGFFYSTVENIEEKTSLSKYQQAQAIEKLRAAQLIEVEKRGLPARRFIKINEENLLRVFDHKKSKNLTTGGEKIEPLEVKKLDSNKTKEKKTKEKDKREDIIDVLESFEIVRNNPEIREALMDFIEMRKKSKKPLTTIRALKLNINDAIKLSGGEPDIMLKIIEQSIKNSWLGFYELKEKTNTDDYFEMLLKETEGQTIEIRDNTTSFAGIPDSLPELL